MTAGERRGLVETVNVVMTTLERAPSGWCQIQREGNINYHKLRRIMDALLDMEFMSYFMNGKRKQYFLTAAGRAYLRLTDEVLVVSDMCRKD